MSTQPLPVSARDNPWYVLATIMGEPTDRADDDEALQDKNRKVWNSWASQGLSDEGKVEKSQKSVVDIFAGVESWSEIRDHIEAEFEKRLPHKEIPDPSEMVGFGNLLFDVPVSFRMFFFQEHVNFTGAIFTEDANFRGAEFTEDADFSGAEFAEDVSFGGANFKGTDFIGAKFTKVASFHHATFTEDAFFRGATFKKGTDFKGATFEARSLFQNASFKGSVDFTDASFDKPCNLREATFTKEYPCLEGTNLHAKTTITADDSHWPRVESSKRHWTELIMFILPLLWIWGVHVVPFLRLWGEPVDLPALLFTPLYTLPYVIVFAIMIGLRLRQKKIITDEKKDKEAMTSCAHLRDNMAAQGLPEHAHFFFRREMELKSQTVSGREKCWYWAYKILSNFGHSIWRPLGWFGALWLLMASVLYGPGVLKLADIPTCGALNPFQLSFANMFPSFLFSAGEHFPDSLLVHAPWLEWLMWFQTILGSVLVFLFILGLRNRFRL